MPTEDRTSSCYACFANSSSRALPSEIHTSINRRADAQAVSQTKKATLATEETVRAKAVQGMVAAQEAGEAITQAAGEAITQAAGV